MIDKMTLAELKRIINDSEAAELHEYIEEVNAIDIAVISEDLDDRELWRLCQLLQDDDLAKVLEQASITKHHTLVAGAYGILFLSLVFFIADF